MSGSGGERSGYDWFTAGAQKGVGQPPYVLRWRNRWWRTKPVSCDVAGSDNNMSGLVRSALDAIGRMPYGMRRCLDYMSRTNTHLRDLPLFDDAEAEMLLREESRRDPE